MKNVHFFRLATLEFEEDRRAELYKNPSGSFESSSEGFARFAHAAYSSVSEMLNVDMSPLAIRFQIPGMQSIKMSEDAVLNLLKGLFDLGCGHGKSPFAWQAHAEQRQPHRQSRHFSCHILCCGR